MKEYNGYKIPEVDDIGGTSVSIPNILMESPKGEMISLPITIEDISRMSEDEANALIESYCHEIICDIDDE